MACRTRAAPAPSASSATPTGKPFHTTTLRRVLTNPRMAGLRVHRGEVIGEASWEPVISRGDFERLRGLFSGRPRQRIGRPQTYPYSGLLRCGHKGCGGRMTGSSRGATQKAYGCERCDRTWITARPVEAFMDEAVIATLAGEEFAASLQEQMRAWAAEDPATAAQEETYQQGRLPAPTAPMPPAALNLPRELPPGLPSQLPTDQPPPAGRRRRARRRRGARLVRGRPARGGTA